MVGANGFEPSTSWSRTRRASQAALRPDRYAQAHLCDPSWTFRLTQLHARGLHAAVSRVISWLNERPPRLALFTMCSSDFPPLLNHLFRHATERGDTAGRL
jgi:hypothetical protein